jgi:hypothetical protein
METISILYNAQRNPGRGYRLCQTLTLTWYQSGLFPVSSRSRALHRCCRRYTIYNQKPKPAVAAAAAIFVAAASALQLQPCCRRRHASSLPLPSSSAVAQKTHFSLPQACRGTEICQTAATAAVCTLPLPLPLPPRPKTLIGHFPGYHGVVIIHCVARDYPWESALSEAHLQQQPVLEGTCDASSSWCDGARSP